MDLKELEELAIRELKHHGLRGWTFALSRAKLRLGACNYRKKRIEVAEYHARNNPPEVVLDTLRHELAHAIAGPEARHGPAWKAVALRLGASPRACASAGESSVPPGDWQATCPRCGIVYHRYRRPMSTSGYRCRCEACAPLVFEFVGDPARKPTVPIPIEPTANWEATCPGCGTVHRRVRRPKPGLWSCKCPRRCEIVWRPRSG